MAWSQRVACALCVFTLASALTVTFKEPEGKVQANASATKVRDPIADPDEEYCKACADRDEEYCNIYPGLCKVGCVALTKPKILKKKWQLGEVSTDGHPSMLPICMDMTLAVKYDLCWTGHMRDFYETETDHVSEKTDLGEDDNGYCFHSGACDDQEITDATTLEGMESICNTRFGSHWQTTYPRFIDILYEPGLVKYQSAEEARRSSYLRCLTGTYHCDVQACKATYCTKQDYMEKYLHPGPPKPNAPKGSAQEAENWIEEQDKTVAAHGFFGWSATKGWLAECYRDDEKLRCLDEELLCPTDGRPSHFEQRLWNSLKAATPSGHSNLRVFCAYDTERMNYALANRAHERSPDDTAAKSFLDQKRQVISASIHKMVYEPESVLQEVVKYCTTQGLCDMEVPATAEAAEMSCDALYGHGGWTSVYLESKVPVHQELEYAQLVGMQSCAAGLFRFDVMMCQEIVCWDTTLRCDEKFCEGNTGAAPTAAPTTKISTTRGPCNDCEGATTGAPLPTYDGPAPHTNPWTDVEPVSVDGDGVVADPSTWGPGEGPKAESARRQGE